MNEGFYKLKKCIKCDGRSYLKSFETMKMKINQKRAKIKRNTLIPGFSARNRNGTSALEFIWALTVSVTAVDFQLGSKLIL